MDNNVLKLKDKDGNIIEYKIILVFVYKNKNYIVYTDNGIDVYASTFVPNDNSVFESVKTDEEWDEIERLLNDLEGEEYE